MRGKNKGSKEKRREEEKEKGSGVCQWPMNEIFLWMERAEKSFYFSLLFLYFHTHQVFCWSTLISVISCMLAFLTISCFGLCNGSFNAFVFLYTHFSIFTELYNTLKQLFNKERKSYILLYLFCNNKVSVDFVVMYENVMM